MAVSAAGLRSLPGRRCLHRLGVLVAAGLLAACSPTAPNSPTVSTSMPRAKPGLTVFGPHRRVPITGLSGPTLQGPPLRVSSLRGHVVVVNVWASWCTQCRAESRVLARLAHRMRRSGVRFVGIDEQDLASKARVFAARAATDYPQLIDAYGTLLAKLPMLPGDAIPSTLVIDAHGGAAARFVGTASPGQLRRVVRRIARSDS